jgi:hypothetical protein
MTAELRVRLRPSNPGPSALAGAIWPPNHQLAALIPALARALAQFGPTILVEYNLTAWATAPERVHCDGHVVWVNGYSNSPNDLLLVSLAEGRGRLALLVVRPETAPERAEQLLHSVVEGAPLGWPTRPSTVLRTGTGPVSVFRPPDLLSAPSPR